MPRPSEGLFRSAVTHCGLAFNGRVGKTEPRAHTTRSGRGGSGVYMSNMAGQSGGVKRLCGALRYRPFGTRAVQGRGAFPKTHAANELAGYAAAGWRQSTHGAGTRPDLGPSPLPQEPSWRAVCAWP